MSNPISSSGNVSDEDHQDSSLSASESVEEDMNGYNMSNSRQQIYELAQQVLAKSQHWNYRQQPRYTASTSIVSSSSDEPTIDLNQPSTQCNFNPSEITGRSTATNDASMSVEQILGESQCSDVRALANELRIFKMRESQGGEDLAYTADVSLTSSKSFRSSMSRPDDWGQNDRFDGVGSDVFVPAERVKDFLMNEEHLWAKEYATLPPEPVESEKQRQLELSDFSRFRLANESENESNASFGQFFIKRSENLCEMLPNTSPTRDGKPLALIDSVNTTQDIAGNGDDTKTIASSSLWKNKTSSKEGESFISHAAIESYFQKCNDFSPKTVTSNLMKLKKSSTAKTTEPVPLKPIHTKVNVLKVEKFNGNLAALRENLSHLPIPVRSALLTPGGHIRRNDFNKENEMDVVDAENVCDRNVSTDTLSRTLSMSGYLSSSKVQGNSTKTSHEEQRMNPAVPQHSVRDDANESKNSVAQSTNDDTTPTTSPIPNRKRNRSNDGTPSIRTPPNVVNSLDVYYNSKHRLTPSPRVNQSKTSSARTPPNVVTSSDVYYNSKHRLTPSPQINQSKNVSQGTPGTPATPRSKANLNILFNHNHRMSPSPNSSKEYTTESGNTTPRPNSQHSTQSANFFAPTLSNMHHFDCQPRSPRLLAQSNSQFSSVSDLREFAIKSSQSVISWPSQKLRTPSIKQFTIKNIGGKKLTMKIEVVGPGFQLSPSEPFQLIALQAQECRTISVTFCPMAIGAAMGKLIFCHAKDSADKTIRKIIPLYGYGGHTVVEVQGVSQGVVGNPFLQLGTIGDLLNLQMHGTFSIYNKGPLSGVAIVRVKSDLKKPTASSSYSAITITPAKCVIGADSHTRIDIAYRPRKNDVRKLLRQEGNVLAVATLEVFMADEPSRQRILELINRFANNSSDIYLLDELFRGITTNVVENFAEFHETEDMIAELFNKMKSTEIVLTVKRSTMDQTIESEHDFFMSDSNESMFLHTLVSDDFVAPPVPAMVAATKNVTAATHTNIPSSSSVLYNPAAAVPRPDRILADNWYLNKSEIRLNATVGEKSQIEITSKSRSQQIFEVDSNYLHLFVIDPDCGVLSPGSTATINVTLKSATLPSDLMYIRIRVDKKVHANVPVIIDK